MPEQTVKDPKRTGVKAVLLAEFHFHAAPGSCIYSPEHGVLEFACPGGGLWGGCRIGHPKPVPPPSWDIVEGKAEEPASLTLQPSIYCKGCCNWHGYLRNGVFESC